MVRSEQFSSNKSNHGQSAQCIRTRASGRRLKPAGSQEQLRTGRVEDSSAGARIVIGLVSCRSS